MRQHLLASMITLAALAAIPATTAQALTTYTLSEKDELAIVGLVQNNVWICVCEIVPLSGGGRGCANGTTALVDQQVFAGTTFLDDILVDGALGDDAMFIVGAGFSSPTTGPCAHSWGTPSYGTYDGMLHGGKDDDFVAGGDGSGDLQGDDGNDTVIIYWDSQAEGNAGADHVQGAGASVNSETLLGNAGDDCIDDISNAYASIDCGAGTDDSPESTTSNCEGTATCLP